ncbi:GspE/PulE family protein [Candidatus Parcubacteria bacterium]|nr:GspE/PulE family protein [Candidatus Parcubacteria bacterium]
MAAVEFNEEKQNQKVSELHKQEEENLAQTLSIKYGIDYIDLAPIPVSRDALRLIPEEHSREAKLAIFAITDKKMKIGVLSPQNPKTIEVVNELKERGYVPTLFMVSTQSLEKVWSRYKDLSFSFETKSGALDISNDQIMEFIHNVRSIEDTKKLIQDVLTLKKSARISRILEIVLAGALAINASDIHIEPEEDYVRLRYRLDGVLTDILNFDRETFSLLLSRMKLISGLKLNIKGTAQDGRFSIKIGDDDVEIRTSILPGAYDESVVLRVLNPNAISVPMEELGIPTKLLSVLLGVIKKPNGMILTTGPTGSGKTTTLYAFLKKIHTPEIKIITIENPIEYHLPGIVQTQTDQDKGYTFLEGLRSALRQDPDVIMVGEIRDSETAEIAINSALTGHLVFSTLHTNNAAGSFPRLIDLGVNPKILSSAVNIAIAQRLIRRLCPDCKKEIAPDEREKKIIEAVLAKTPEDEKKDISVDKMWKPVGCAKCNNTGYRGRIGIYEGILMDEEIEKIVTENPSEREINKAAEHQHILTLAEDGILKVLRGMTSLEELERVVDLLGSH